jgi:hypothetical protein
LDGGTVRLEKSLQRAGNIVLTGARQEQIGQNAMRSCRRSLLTSKQKLLPTFTLEAKLTPF